MIKQTANRRFERKNKAMKIVKKVKTTVKKNCIINFKLLPSKWAFNLFEIAKFEFLSFL